MFTSAKDPDQLFIINRKIVMAWLGAQQKLIRLPWKKLSKWVGDPAKLNTDDMDLRNV